MQSVSQSVFSDNILINMVFLFFYFSFFYLVRCIVWRDAKWHMLLQPAVFPVCVTKTAQCTHSIKFKNKNKGANEFRDTSCLQPQVSHRKCIFKIWICILAAFLTRSIGIHYHFTIKSSMMHHLQSSQWTEAFSKFYSGGVQQSNSNCCVHNSIQSIYWWIINFK